MKKKKIMLIILGLALLAAIPLGIKYYRGHGGHDAAQHKEQYHCPMHPTYTSTRKDDSCPICGMNLVKSEEAAPAAPTGGKIKFYRNPMNPAITSKTPMKDEMGMDYVPVYVTEGESKEVGGRAPIKMDSAKRQLIGVKTARAAYRALTHTVTSSGKVAYDPDLYQSISEYKEALTARDKVKDSSWPEVHERAEALIRASALRLRQAGLSDEQITELAQGGDTHANLLLPGAKAWLYAQIYEYEIGLIKPGQEIEAATPAYPGKIFRGVIKAVDSILSAETRTLRVRAEVENPDNMLKPEMYAEIKIKVTLGSRLSVPLNAIVNTGARKLVFVDKGEAGFEPREVKTGFEGDDYSEILSGVRAGETVVTSANFLIDSEARLKSSVTE
ncbi:MAG: efflux RND transporter periplasmic adaptor subunit [Elusimicrobiales bacterium]|nr:efflux RND transporter periplasmic adaptor subunit [Elusimicrobiales bacterium]